MKNLQDTLVKTIPGNLLLKIDVNAILENTAHDVDGIDVYNEKVEKCLKQCKKNAEYVRRWRELHKEEVAEYNRNYQKANADAVAEYKRRWAELNKEKRAGYWRKYEQSHKEKRAEYRKQYYEAHKEEKAEYFRRYREENKEIIAERKRRQRAKKKAERLAALAQTLNNESTESTTI